MTKHKYHTVLIRNANQNDFGGAERYVVFLASELTRIGHHPLIVSGHQSTLRFANDNQVDYHKSPFLGLQNWSGWRNLLLPTFFFWQAYLTIYYYFFFRKTGAKTIHLHSRDDFIAGTIAGKWLHANIIWTDHADLKHIFNNLTSPLKNPIGKLIFSLSKHVRKIIFISESERRLVENVLPDKNHFKDKGTVIYNGSIDYFNGDQKNNKNNNNFIFAFIGRLVKDKGIEELISAFQKLNKNKQNISLWIIGDGEERTGLESIANKKIKLFGHVKQPQKLLEKIDCLVAPSYHEGLGMSVIEGCMMRKPVIASKVGGIPEIITDGVNGLLIEPKNVDQLCGAMAKIVDNPALATELAKNARNTYLKSFNFTKIVAEQIIPLYNLKPEDVKDKN